MLIFSEELSSKINISVEILFVFLKRKFIFINNLLNDRQSLKTGITIT